MTATHRMAPALAMTGAMQILRLSLVSALLFTALPAADWYVAPSGSDAAAGTQAAPLATLAGAVTKATGSSDRILLQTNGTYRIIGNVTIPTGRTVTSYGSGAQPVVTASRLVSFTGTWASNSAVSTVSVGSEALACWVNGAFVPMARTPNSGWLQTDTGTNKDLIVVTGANPATWSGAQVRWRRWSWWWEIRPINAISGNNLTLGGSATEDGIPGSVGSSYCVDHYLGGLDTAGEWYSSATTFYLYPPSGTTTVEIATDTAQISTSGATFDNIAFRRFAGKALGLNDGVSTVRNCTFAEIEDIGINLSWNAGGSQIADNVFTTIRNTAISWLGGGAAGGVIERNVFAMIGMQPGYGGQGTWHSAGIVINNGNGVIVRLNRFTDIGYCGIIVGNAGQTIDRNYFRRCTRTLNDGGAIYTNCSNTIITNNIVLDSIGDTETGQPWFPLGQGIWPEFLGYRNTTDTGNTVTGCNGNGVFMSNHPDSVISNNTCLDNQLAGLHLDSLGNDTISGNILGNPPTTRRTTAPENLWYPNGPSFAILSERGIDYGTMSGTTFIGSGAVMRTTKSGQADTDYFSVATWAAAESSWADAGAVIKARDCILLINDSPTLTDLTPPAGSWTRIDGTAVSGAVTVSPFASVVLTSATSVPAAKPYYLASAGGAGGGKEIVAGSRTLGRYPGGAAPTMGDLTLVAAIFAAVPASTGGTGGSSTSGSTTGGGTTTAGTTTGSTTTAGTTTSGSTTTTGTTTGAPSTDEGGGGGCGVSGGLALMLLSTLALWSRRRAYADAGSTSL